MAALCYRSGYMTHPEPSVSLRHWERVVASIPRPFKRACHGPPPSGRLHLPQSFHCFGRGRYDVWHDWEESDPKQQEKAAGFGEKQRPNHISGTRYCVHKKDPRRSFCKAPSCKSPEARVSPLQTISERTWLFPRQASGTLVRSANWSLGRPGGSANLPTKIQAVPAAAPCLQHWVLYAETTRPPPPQLWALQLFSSPQQYPTTYRRLRRETLSPRDTNPKRSTLQSIVLESPKSQSKIYSDEEHNDRGATGKTKREPIG